ncbi:FAD-dependent oxidoreductase [Dactylosporangium sp. CA-233914]|uniref:FAD-dependent oxidoreductase n=1 Tax=Dactylosporangium sp. CA-233914 TaxID=3239934 RepID=UPI003D8E2123
MTNFRVMVIGGGIGGLTLAHGLRRAGVAVEVYERTRQRSDWLQGYRIHINPHGARALHECLPPAGWRRFLDTAAAGGGFGFLTERGTELLGLSEAEINPREGAPTDRHYAVSRILLRETLLDGLGDVVRHGRTFSQYTVSEDRVVAHFEDGGTAEADLLVGADGANSRVRAQLLPRAHRQDTGVVAIAGKHPLAGADLPPLLAGRANIVVPRGRGSLFTAPWPGEYVLWGFSDAADRLPPDVETLAGEALQRLVEARLDGWAPAFRRLVAGSDPGTVNAFRVRSAAVVSPWPTGRVTLLGDAIHNMTPMAGIGANTALRDAALLCRRLAEGRPLPEAVGEYEREMLDYGFAAVRRSLRNARGSATSTRAGRAAFRSVLRLTAATPPLRRALARRLG